MKKRGRKKKQLKTELEHINNQVSEQDGPVLDLEKSIIKKLIKQGKKDGYLTNELIKKSFPEEKFTSEQIEQYTTKLSQVGFDIIDSDDSDNDDDKDEDDIITTMNEEVETWKAEPVMIQGKKYAARKVKNNEYILYDPKAYERAIKTKGQPTPLKRMRVLPDDQFDIQPYLK